MEKAIIFICLCIGMLFAGDFEVKGSMVYDEETKLLWQKNPSNKKMTWSEAKDYCESLELRLPNLYELKSLVDYTKYNPAIRTDLINIKTDDWYWSASEFKGVYSYVWVVDFFHGGEDDWGNKKSSYYVLCVSGQ